MSEPEYHMVVGRAGPQLMVYLDSRLLTYTTEVLVTPVGHCRHVTVNGLTSDNGKPLEGGVDEADFLESLCGARKGVQVRLQEIGSGEEATFWAHVPYFRRHVHGYVATLCGPMVPLK